MFLPLLAVTDQAKPVELPSRYAAGRRWRSSIPGPAITLLIMGCPVFGQVERTIPGSPYKIGDIVEFLDKVGRSYLEDGYIKEVSVADHLRSLQAANDARLEERITTVVKDAIGALRGSTPPRTPSGDPGVEITSVRGGESSVERGRKSTTDVMRCIALASLGEGETRTRSDLRLREVYGCVRSNFTDGVTRDGTESISGGPTYGYLVKPEYISDVFRVMAEESVMTGMRSVPIGSAIETNYPALDQFGTTSGGKSSNYFAGVTLYRAGEITARTASDAVTNNIPFKVTDLTGLTKVSRDLIADSFVSIDAFLGQLFGDAFRHRMDYDYIRGSGVGEPYGWFNAPSTIGGGGVSGNATRKTANQILYDDLTWMLSKLHPNCWGSGMWVTHPSTIPYLMGIQSAAGTFVYQPSSLISQADRPSIYGPGRFQGTMLGLPVRFTEKVPQLGTTGDLNLISVNQYGECLRSGIEMAVAYERYFENDEIGFKWKARNDGKPLWRKAFTDMTGFTSSWAVQLV